MSRNEQTTMSPIINGAFQLHVKGQNGEVKTAEFFVSVNHNYDESKQTKWIQTYQLRAKTKTLEPA